MTLRPVLLVMVTPTEDRTDRIIAILELKASSIPSLVFVMNGLEACVKKIVDKILQRTLTVRKKLHSTLSLIFVS